MEDKKKLRIEMHQKRANIDSAQKKLYDQKICHQLEGLILQQKARVVHAYLPMGKEIDISPLLSSLLMKGIIVVTPKTLRNRKLQNLVLTSLTEVEQGVFGTTHPANSIEYTGSFDFIIVPGLAFDNANYRLGYGGGYYDNFLVNHPKAIKVGIFYPVQQVDKVPIESHDIQLDTIISLENF
ncbi:MAG: 5-formyltetrahydrofolate cyclo-ligase [Flavobacteriales bacterium]